MAGIFLPVLLYSEYRFYKNLLCHRQNRFLGLNNVNKNQLNYR